MRAVHVEKPGGPEVLNLVDLADPAPVPGDLVIDVSAAGINYADISYRRGVYPVPLPGTPGLEGLGVVTALGQGVTGFSVGDRVAWHYTMGSYAEQAVIPAARAVAVPNEITDEMGAAILSQGITANY